MLNKFSKNLDMFFNMATDDMIKEGLEWYQKAHEFCEEMSKEYEYCPLVVAGVVSALSPRNKWQRNLEDAEAVLHAVNEGLSPDEVKVCTFNKNKYKAFAIAKREVSIAESSRKTYAFVENIASLNEDYVTIDVWHQRALFNKFIESMSVGKIAYEQIQELTIKKAKEVGMKGYEYQAVIWVSVKEHFNN